MLHVTGLRVLDICVNGLNDTTLSNTGPLIVVKIEATEGILVPMVIVAVDWC